MRKENGRMPYVLLMFVVDWAARREPTLCRDRGGESPRESEDVNSRTWQAQSGGL